MNLDATAVNRDLPGLDIPFLPLRSHVELVNRLAGRIACLHFSLSDPDIHDARPLREAVPSEAFLELLAQTVPAARFALMNSRFLPPAAYRDRSMLDHLAGRLSELLSRGLVRGVVYADLLLAKALSDHAPSVAGELEAVPSINCRLDSPEKLEAHLDALSATRFRPPSRVMADRSLNRDLDGRKRFHLALNRLLPDADMVLMANEGCLPHCPYKDTHDSLHAFGRSADGDPGFQPISGLGCVPRFLDAPWLCLASPFIRPEDQRHAADPGVVLKLCGRSLGPRRLECIITAYAAEHHQGNLLDLLDAQDAVRQRISIDNQALPPDFWERTRNCRSACRRCGYCARVFKAAGRLHRARILPRAPLPGTGRRP